MKNYQAWVVAVDMGYGHQRAAYPLRHLSPGGKVINANNYEGIPKSDYDAWNNSRKAYEFISRFNMVPFIGRKIFGIMDYFQRIKPFYPKRDLSEPSTQLLQTYHSIRKGWGRHLVEHLNTKDIPLITTFFTAAYFAEEHGFKNDIYLVLCDADVSRAWVALNPKKSRINYLAPCRRTAARLRLYGVKEENIFLTGFPLPEENLGNSHLRILKGDLSRRIENLDPRYHYRQKYGGTMREFLKDHTITNHRARPLTLTFAVGGAGAQQHLAHDILVSLRKKLLDGEMVLNLVSGVRNDVHRFFCDEIHSHGMSKILDKNIFIVCGTDKEEYFQNFNDALRHSDILWTKPSELVFYSALGLPIIMAPTIGSQEEYNRYWLNMIGAGLPQENPHYTHEWLFDWIHSGWLAEAAMAGFLDGRQFGVENMTKVVFEGVKEPAKEYQLL